MLKKILFVALLSLPLGAFAQEKIAYITSQEVIMALPETKALQAEIEKMGQQYEAELKTMEDELSKKYQALTQSGDTLVESIRIRRLNEIQEIRQKAETFNQDAQQKIYATQQEKMAPIQQKVLDAIKAVSEENNFTYVMEKSLFHYVSPSSSDATPLVKKKLGLQ